MRENAEKRKVEVEEVTPGKGKASEKRELAPIQPLKRPDTLKLFTAGTLKAPACIRTGMCCESILLYQSPATMRRAFRAYSAEQKRELPSDQIGRQDDPSSIIDKDIWLIYPMLAGTCRGKVNMGGCWRYVYGPCKNLGREIVGIVEMATCTIHEDRPRLCWGYPEYNRNPHMVMNDRDPQENPGYMKGCGYNSDKKANHDPKEFEAGKLVPLEEDEK